MKEQAVGESAAAWFGGDTMLFDICTEEPELAWRVILEILSRGLTTEQTEDLAAGPLETLLSWHGAEFIDRVEQEARLNPKFNHLLGGVWRQEMQEEIWGRVQKARKEVW